jgi:hypothetical protein
MKLFSLALPFRSRTRVMLSGSICLRSSYARVVFRFQCIVLHNSQLRLLMHVKRASGKLYRSTIKSKAVPQHTMEAQG